MEENQNFKKETTKRIKHKKNNYCPPLNNKYGVLENLNTETTDTNSTETTPLIFVYGIINHGQMKNKLG